MNTIVLTALVKMSVFFLHFLYCCFWNFHFSEMFWQVSKNQKNKIPKQEDRKQQQPENICKAKTNQILWFKTNKTTSTNKEKKKHKNRRTTWKKKTNKTKGKSKNQIQKWETERKEDRQEQERERERERDLQHICCRVKNWSKICLLKLKTGPFVFVFCFYFWKSHSSCRRRGFWENKQKKTTKKKNTFL